MHISQDHHLDRQVLQFWKALQQFNDNVHLIIHVDEQGLDRLPHCCKTDCPKMLHKNKQKIRHKTSRLKVGRNKTSFLSNKMKLEVLSKLNTARHVRQS